MAGQLTGRTGRAWTDWIQGWDVGVEPVEWGNGWDVGGPLPLQDQQVNGLDVMLYYWDEPGSTVVMIDH